MRKIKRIHIDDGSYIIDLDGLCEEQTNLIIKFDYLIDAVKDFMNDVVREHLYYHVTKDTNMVYKSKEAENEEIKNTVIKKTENLIKKLDEIKKFTVKTSIIPEYTKPA